jgi:CheY-like chemotaxis protein
MTQKPNVLIIDDDAVCANLYATYLEAAGFAVAIRAEPDLRLVGDDRVDLILLDLYFPQAGVWDVLPALRQRWPRDEVPVIMLSAEDHDAVHDGLVALGANEFLVKSQISAARLVERARFWTRNCPAGRPARRSRVLLAEDDPLVRSVAAEMLAAAEFEVVEAADGIEALDLLGTEQPFDLVICDLHMPRLGGAEIARQVSRRYPQTRVLAISGEPPEEPIASAGFLAKPFRHGALIAAARKALAAETAQRN